MPTSSTIYSQEAIDRLTERTAYEMYLLEEVFKLEEKWTAERYVEEIAAWAGEGKVMGGRTTTLHVRSNALGPLFIPVGAPLLFVTAFKLLDMVIEWCIATNGREVKLQFIDKLNEWEPSKGLVLPPALQAEPELHQVVVALYRRLYNFRNTIIHREDFEYDQGVLHTVWKDKKKLALGDPIDISDSELGSFADFMVSLVQVLQGKRCLDAFEVMRLKICADQMVKLHLLPSFDQRRPVHVRINYLVPSEQAHQPINIAEIRTLVDEAIPREDVIHELVVAVSDADSHTAYGLTNTALQSCPPLIDVQYMKEHGTSRQLTSTALGWINRVHQSGVARQDA